MRKIEESSTTLETIDRINALIALLEKFYHKMEDRADDAKYKISEDIISDLTKQKKIMIEIDFQVKLFVQKYSLGWYNKSQLVLLGKELANEELVNNIENFDYNKYLEDCKHYVDEIQYYDDGNASKAIVDVITCKIMDTVIY